MRQQLFIGVQSDKGSKPKARRLARYFWPRIIQSDIVTINMLGVPETNCPLGYAFLQYALVID